MAYTASIDPSTPRLLIIAAEGTRREVEPSGRERIARRWFSN
jgi:hypothetical protein